MEGNAEEEESFPMTAAAAEVTVEPATPTAEDDDGPESAAINPMARECRAARLRLNIEKEPLAPTQSSGPTLKIPSPRLTFDLEAAGQTPPPPLSPLSPPTRGDRSALPLPPLATGATTAPVFVNERGRFFSFGGAGGVGAVGGVGNKAHLTNVRDSMRRYRYVRQNTVSGDPELREFPRRFTRAISHAAESAAGKVLSHHDPSVHYRSLPLLTANFAGLADYAIFAICKREVVLRSHSWKRVQGRVNDSVNFACLLGLPRFFISCVILLKLLTAVVRSRNLNEAFF